jgi:kumamolisin
MTSDLTEVSGKMHGKTALPGSERHRPSNSRLVSPVSPEEDIHLNVVIRRRPDAPPVPDLAYWQKTPLLQRQHISPQEYRETYGAAPADLALVSEFLSQHGMRILEASLGTRTISVISTARQIQNAFDVHLNHYETVFPQRRRVKLSHSTNRQADPEPHAHNGFDGRVHIPPYLEGILIAVIGLDDRRMPHGGPAIDPSGGANAIPVETAARLYNFPTTDCRDQTIGIISCQGGYQLSDLRSYFNTKTMPTLVDISLFADGTTWTNPGLSAPNVLETTGDISVAGTVAQGCTINTYFTTNSEMGWHVFLNRILQPQSGERQPTIVSCSWTLELMDDKPVSAGTGSTGFSNFGILSSLFQDLALLGISLFTDTG